MRLMTRLFAAMAVLVLLGGCGQDSETLAYPWWIPSVDVEPEQADVPPLVNNWFRYANSTMVTNKSYGLIEADAECKLCLAMMRAAEQRAARGSRVEGGAIVPGEPTMEVWDCGVHYDCNAQVVVDGRWEDGVEVLPDGTRLPVTVAGEFRLRFWASTRSGDWRITKVQLL